MVHHTRFYRKNILVIGLGISGRSAAQLLLTLEANVIAYDQNLTKIALEDLHSLTLMGLKVSSEYPQQLLEFDLIVVSPGIPRNHPLYESARELSISIIGEIELACELIAERNQKFLAVTGTNGKTTVTLMVTHVLNHCGIQARALGNMGVPLTTECLFHNVDEVLVVELSSYQLETLRTHVIDVAVVLNITPDHLDRYLDMQEYAKSKLHIANCLKADGRLYVEENCWQDYGHLHSTTHPKLYGYNTKCDLSMDLHSWYNNQNKICDLPAAFKGKKSHDNENLLAAYALCHEMGIKSIDFLKAVETFKKPAHRIEFVKKINQISFYNDSKGTNIDAVIRAVQIMDGPVVLIAGGVDKGSAYTPWLKVFSNKVKCICAIGEAARKIELQLSSHIPVHLFVDLEMAVRYAASVASKGDNVLLSPGCASFDMFRDYAHRGDEFKRIVNEF